MPNTLAELELEIRKQSEQLAALQKRAADLRSEERVSVIETIRTQIVDYEITPAELGLEPLPARGKPVPKRGAAKYVGPQGQTWSGGRGRKPRWVTDALAAGKSLVDLELKPR